VSPQFWDCFSTLVRRETGKESWVQVPYSEDKASHAVPELCVSHLEVRREAFTWVRAPLRGPTWLAARGYKIAEVNMDFEDALWNAPYARCVANRDDASIQKLHVSYLAIAEQYYVFFRQLSQMVYGRDVKYVLLLHVGAFDARMLPDLPALYQSKGVSFISLSDAIADAVYQDDPDIGEPTGGAQLELMMQKKQLRFPANGKPWKELESMCR
jgi:hypothetical protein